jgi:hypothetical protein
MNDLVDTLSGFAFHRAIQLENFIASDFLFEKLWIEHNGKNITSNVFREINTLTGEQSAMKHFAESGRTSREIFQKIWWDGMENLTKSYPNMYQM